MKKEYSKDDKLFLAICLAALLVAVVALLWAVYGE